MGGQVDSKYNNIRQEVFSEGTWLDEKGLAAALVAWLSAPKRRSRRLAPR